MYYLKCGHVLLCSYKSDKKNACSHADRVVETQEDSCRATAQGRKSRCNPFCPTLCSSCLRSECFWTIWMWFWSRAQARFFGSMCMSLHDVQRWHFLTEVRAFISHTIRYSMVQQALHRLEQLWICLALSLNMVLMNCNEPPGWGVFEAFNSEEEPSIINFSIGLGRGPGEPEVLQFFICLKCNADNAARSHQWTGGESLQSSWSRPSRPTWSSLKVLNANPAGKQNPHISSNIPHIPSVSICMNMWTCMNASLDNLHTCIVWFGINRPHLSLSQLSQTEIFEKVSIIMRKQTLQ